MPACLPACHYLYMFPPQWPVCLSVCLTVCHPGKKTGQRVTESSVFFIPNFLSGKSSTFPGRGPQGSQTPVDPRQDPSLGFIPCLPGIPDSRGSQTPVWDLDRTGAAVERISCFFSVDPRIRVWDSFPPASDSRFPWIPRLIPDSRLGF